MGEGRRYLFLQAAAKRDAAQLAFNASEGSNTMHVLSRPLAVAAFAAASLTALPPAASAQSFSPEQRNEIQRVIKEYLVSNPEVLQEAIAELEKRQAVAEAD